MPLRPVVTPEGPRELSHAARATLLTQFETLRAAGLAAGLPELAAETARWRAQLLGCRSVGAVAAYDFAAEVARCCRAVFVAREAVWQTASSAPSSTDRAVVDALHARLFHPPHYPVDTGRSRRSDEHSCLFPDTFVALDHALHAMAARVDALADMPPEISTLLAAARDVLHHAEDGSAVRLRAMESGRRWAESTIRAALASADSPVLRAVATHTRAALAASPLGASSADAPAPRVRAAVTPVLSPPSPVAVSLVGSPSALATTHPAL